MYSAHPVPRRNWLRPSVAALVVLGLLLLMATVGVWQYYSANLQPVSAEAKPQSIEIVSGATPSDIASLLHEKDIIRNAWTFERYVQSKGVSGDLQAGTYSLSGAQSVPDIVSLLSHGKVTTQLITILPGQRLDQIRQSLINNGFSEADVDAALNPANYQNNAALVDKPGSNSLEGYLYPDSFQRDSSTKATTIIKQSVDEMQQHLTPEVRAAFARQGLSVYQGVTLASIVEQEVSHQADRAQAAQVFLKRLRTGMSLGSDVTAYYGSRLAGQGKSVTFDSAYNTRLHAGLPPTPISNISDSSLRAVAFPADTDWLFFVAGDDGTTYFSKTVEEHDALAAKYCHKLCQE